MDTDSLPRTIFFSAPAAFLVILLATLVGSSGDSATPVRAASVSGSSPATGPIQTEPNFKVAFIGDTEYNSNFVSVLNLIEAEGADLVLHQGDFDYHDDPDGFFGVIAANLDPSIPYLGSVGNHDIGSWNEGCSDPDGCYATFFKAQMTAHGIVPDEPNLNDQKYAAEYGGVGLFFAGESTSQATDCGTNPAGYACYLRTKLQTDRHIWRICSWHKNQQAMQVGSKTDEMSWAIYDACVDQSAIIATGHEHSYSRTLTLTDPQTQAIDLVQHPLVSGIPSNPNSLRVKPGSSFVHVSGLGGNSMRPQTRCLPATYPYGCNHEWASIYSTNQTPGGVERFGALFIEFYVDGDPYKARGYFKTTTGQTIDSFEIRADYVDTDADGIQNGIDTCPAWVNPAQVSPGWSIPAGDSDCDGFPDTVAIPPPSAIAAETSIGTNPARHCMNTPARHDEPTPDAWPADADDNQLANGSDLLMFAPSFGAISPDPRYNVRFDLNGDLRVNGTDLLQIAPFFGKKCA